MIPDREKACFVGKNVASGREIFVGWGVRIGMVEILRFAQDDRLWGGG
jgi:hypothetical protein